MTLTEAIGTDLPFKRAGHKLFIPQQGSLRATLWYIVYHISEEDITADDWEVKRNDIFSDLELVLYNIKSRRAGDGDTRTWKECTHDVEAQLEKIIIKHKGSNNDSV